MEGVEEGVGVGGAGEADGEFDGEREGGEVVGWLVGVAVEGAIVVGLTEGPLGFAVRCKVGIAVGAPLGCVRPAAKVAKNDDASR